MAIVFNHNSRTITKIAIFCWMILPISKGQRCQSNLKSPKYLSITSVLQIYLPLCLSLFSNILTLFLCYSLSCIRYDPTSEPLHNLCPDRYQSRFLISSRSLLKSLLPRALTPNFFLFKELSYIHFSLLFFFSEFIIQDTKCFS